MAIYHFSGTIISRSQGRSVVACAAYRAAARLQDAYYGRLHDYTKKQDVVYAEILLPEGAPSWMVDREQLWNAVEQSEKRKDAQLSREFNFALPKELTIEQNIALTKVFVQKAFVNKGMVADVCIHNDLTKEGERQPHAHVMLTLRAVTSEGFGQKVRSWNGKDCLLNWRQEWAEIANQHLALQGHDITIDHRTLEAQGINLEPQYKIGAASVQEQKARFADHQRIAYENGERIEADPEIALDVLTRQQSTFTHQDIARLVNRHTLGAEQFQRVYEKVKASPDLVFLGYDAERRERFTTQEMLALEQRMVGHAEVLAGRETHSVLEQVKEQVLTHYSLSSEQQVAFESLMTSKDLNVVVGYAGTGKSYLLGAARQAWEAQGYRVWGAALSGIAAQNLQESSGIESRTLASHFYYWDRGERSLSAQDILVVDEAGLIASRQMGRLMESVHLHGAKIVLVGDSQQLQAIEAGAAFRAVAERTPYVELTEIRRQKSAWQREATRLLARGEVSQALQAYQRHDHLHRLETPQSAMAYLIDHWNDVRMSCSEESQIILACTRQEVYRLNQMAREVRHLNHELGADQVMQTERGERYFAERDRVYFLQNDSRLGVKNGTLGTIEQILGSSLVVRLDRTAREEAECQVAIDLMEYPHLDHGYAATIYKAQGVTVDRSYVYASRAMDRHATYVGLTRHRESCDIFHNQEEFLHPLSLGQHLGRDRAKDTSLDYGAWKTSFAHCRDIDVPLDADPLTENLLKVQLPEVSRAAREASLSAFKARYEQRHPDMTHLHQEIVLPSEEKLEQVIVEQLERLHQQFLKEGHIDVKHFQTLMKKIEPHPQVLADLQQKHRAFYEKIRQMLYERSQDRGRSR